MRTTHASSRMIGGDSLVEMVGIRVRFEGGRAKSGCSLCNLTEALQTGLRGRRLSAGARAVLQCRTVNP